MFATKRYNNLQPLSITEANLDKIHDQFVESTCFPFSQLRLNIFVFDHIQFTGIMSKIFDLLDRASPFLTEIYFQFTVNETSNIGKFHPETLTKIEQFIKEDHESFEFDRLMKFSFKCEGVRFVYD